MVFYPQNSDVEYFGIDVLENKIISNKIYYKKETAKKKSFDMSIFKYIKNRMLKVFDYSVDGKKQSFGYLINEKNILSLFLFQPFSIFLEKNDTMIKFIDNLRNEFCCYPPVLGIKYLNKNINAIGLYLNPPYKETKYLEYFFYIRDKFLHYYPSRQYENLFKNILNPMILSNYAYLFLFGFDATLEGSKKYKFYLKLSDSSCIDKLYVLLKNIHSFTVEFLQECFYKISQENNSFVDIVAFSFINGNLCLNIYYKQKSD